MISNSKLALGTVQFGLDYGVANFRGQVELKEAFNILRQAEKSGINTLDTAIDYGQSENILGMLGVENWRTVSKVPAIPCDCVNVSDWLTDQVNQSLARLKVECLYGLLLHRPEQLLGKAGHNIYKALKQVQKRGLVQKVGVSVYAPVELERLTDTYEFDLVQAPLSILDRRLVETGWITRLKESGIELHTRSSFLQGLLLMPNSIRPQKFKPWAHIWNEWDCWLERTGLNPLQACLRYVCSLPSVDRVIVGVDSLEQLNQIINAADGGLDCLPEFESLKDARLINPSTWNQL